MTLAEAGKVLGMPVSTVQSRIRRGIARLRKEMEDHED
jgi:DNA-directed RNA polymerase specialized sigma24 family protein